MKRGRDFWVKMSNMTHYLTLLLAVLLILILVLDFMNSNSLEEPRRYARVA